MGLVDWRQCKPGWYSADRSCLAAHAVAGERECGDRPIDLGENLGPPGAAERINASYVSRILRLTVLAPDLVEAILDGRQPEGILLSGVLEGVEVEWSAQQSR